jgi:multiple sugar transport system ATP-binding protein
VALGRAVVREPALFLMDQPRSNLDARVRANTRAELKELQRRLGVTTLYVTHDQIEAMTLADRIVIMEKGDILQVAAPLVLYEQPVNKYVAGFIGSPPMNFFSGQLVRGAGGGISFTDGAGITVPVVPEAAAQIAAFVDQPVTLGLRPEMIREKNSAHGWKTTARVNARIEVAESLGDEKIVYFSTEKNSFVARLDAHVPVAIGQRMEVVFNAGKAHIFNSDIGENLTQNIATH